MDAGQTPEIMVGHECLTLKERKVGSLAMHGRCVGGSVARKTRAVMELVRRDHFVTS